MQHHAVLNDRDVGFFDQVSAAFDKLHEIEPDAIGCCGDGEAGDLIPVGPIIDAFPQSVIGSPRNRTLLASGSTMNRSPSERPSSFPPILNGRLAMRVESAPDLLS